MDGFRNGFGIGLGFSFVIRCDGLAIVANHYFTISCYVQNRFLSFFAVMTVFSSFL